MNIFIVITGFETANAVKDCYKTIEFVIGASVECHNYSIKDDNMCELGIPQQGFQIRLAIIATGKRAIRIDLKRSLATIVIDDTSEMECCKLELVLYLLSAFVVYL